METKKQNELRKELEECQNDKTLSEKDKTNKRREILDKIILLQIKKRHKQSQPIKFNQYKSFVGNTFYKKHFIVSSNNSDIIWMASRFNSPDLIQEAVLTIGDIPKDMNKDVLNDLLEML